MRPGHTGSLDTSFQARVTHRWGQEAALIPGGLQEPEFPNTLWDSDCYFNFSGPSDRNVTSWPRAYVDECVGSLRSFEPECT
jgi:hypothetical protein